MSDGNRLSKQARSLLDEARTAEPSLDDGARTRMRSQLLSMTAAGAAGATALAASSTAKAATGVTTATVSTAPAGPGLAVGATKLITTSFFVKGAAVAMVVAGVTTAVTWDAAHAPAGGPTVVATAPAPTTTEGSPQLVAPPPVSEQMQPPSVEADPSPAPASVSAMPVAAVKHDRKPEIAPEPAPPEPPSKKTDEEFAKELANLDRARGALAAGDPTAALATLDGTPASPAFAEERQALRVVALCGAGRKEEGQRELAKFRAAFPRSLQTARASRACETSRKEP